MDRFANPYTILEIPHGTPFSEVRVKYYKIARIHHPDKFIGSDDEKKTNEDYFKKVTVAYRQIEVAEQNINNGGGGAGAGIFGFGSSNFTYGDYSKDDWRDVWSSVETFFNKPEIWTCMKNIITDKLKDVTTKMYQKHHSVTLELKLEEIYSEKIKKLRLFLKNIPEPVFITVNAANFPHKIIKHAILSNGQEIEITVDCVAIDHDVFRYDNLLGSDDLYTTVNITLAEYILGKKLNIEYLDKVPISVNMLPFGDISKSICVPNKGLRQNKGALWISINISLPDKKLWDLQTIDFKGKFLNNLNALY
jgi:DnaJ-class molecular chaperone